MKTALVLTVKNEERLLRHNLLYHRAIGLDKVFVYFDNTTDKGSESIADLDFVTTAQSVPIEKYDHLDYLNKFTAQAKEHHTARQCLNTFDATQQCKKQGIEWLISIDADELVVPDLKRYFKINNFLNEMPDSIEVVNFQVKEVVQNQFHYNNVFAEASLFKTRAKFKSRWDRVYKRVFNPLTKTNSLFNYWYGHTMGKAAIRVSADLIPHNVHKFIQTDGTKPSTLQTGFLLHYHSFDFQDFVKKFTNFKHHPDTFLSGNSVEDIKLLWRDVVNHPESSQSQLEEYYKSNVMFSEKEIQQLLKKKHYYLIPRRQTAIETINIIKEVFKKHIT